METGLVIWLFTVQKFLIVVGHGTVLQRTRPPVLRYPHSQTDFLSTRPGVLNGLTAYMQQFHLPSHDTSPILYNQKKSPKWRCCFAFFWTQPEDCVGCVVSFRGLEQVRQIPVAVITIAPTVLQDEPHMLISIWFSESCKSHVGLPVITKIVHTASRHERDKPNSYVSVCSSLALAIQCLITTPKYQGI